MAELWNSQHMHGYIYPAQQVCSKDSTDGPKDHLSTTCYTKDQHGPRSIILRGLMVEPWSNHIFRSPRRIRCILRGYPSIRTSFNCCPSQTGGWLTWSTYNTNQDIVTYRPNTDKVQTQVHQQNGHPLSRQQELFPVGECNCPPQLAHTAECKKVDNSQPHHD